MRSHSTTLAEPTVEDLVEAVQHLHPDTSVVPAVARGLLCLDSRALAAMLKELARVGCADRAHELFDWLRALPPGHDLAPLCDVFTFTTAIALCGQRQSLRQALGLVGEMRVRGIACNTHTYSALMNVAIKCGELELALDVFRQLLADGLQANVVTYNTLIDIYGKLGRWQEAIEVLDMIAERGLEPEARTFNTIIIACNMCGRPQEALQVFNEMSARGFVPTATTYTALISAYAKANQLDAALSTFQKMVAEGCERSVITYSSLIGACDKAGRWRLCLDLFHRMKADRISPNAAIFNAAMSACAQGAQAETAEAIFAEMKNGACRPDALTHTSLATAHQRAGNWASAVQVLQDVLASNGRADAAMYSVAIEALWQCDAPRLRPQAARVFDCAAAANVFGLAATKTCRASTLEVTVPAMTAGAALLALHRMLTQLKFHMPACANVALVLGRQPRNTARSNRPEATGQAEAAAALEALGCPCRTVHGVTPNRLESDSSAFTEWLLSADLDQLLLMPSLRESPRAAGCASEGHAPRQAAVTPSGEQGKDAETAENEAVVNAGSPKTPKSALPQWHADLSSWTPVSTAYSSPGYAYSAKTLQANPTQSPISTLAGSSLFHQSPLLRMASDYSLVGGDYGLVSGDYSAVGGSGYCPGSLGSGSAEVAGYWNSPFSIKSAAVQAAGFQGGYISQGDCFSTAALGAALECQPHQATSTLPPEAVAQSQDIIAAMASQQQQQMGAQLGFPGRSSW